MFLLHWISKKTAGEIYGLATPSSSASFSSPGATDLELTKSGTGFKDSTHWTSVLDGVSETNGHSNLPSAFQSEITFKQDSLAPNQNVLLFQGCKHATDQEILDSMPPKGECDRLVAIYFRAQEYRSVIHPAEFLKRYNLFWENPNGATVPWLGLLYSIFCFTIHGKRQDGGTSNLQDTGSYAWSPATSNKILNYREKIVQCLVRGQFAKGGPDIMETMVHYLLIESYMNKESNIEVWLLMGNIVQIVRAAIRMGYHRDPQHFKSLSPYEGEMRRRMWAIIYSLDIGFATQMGLPSSIKSSLSDTLPPRNLQDRDFDADSIDLPPARPMNELTSSTVILSKLHVATSLAIVSDMICSPKPLSHEDLKAANLELDLMHATIPEPCKLRPVLESLLDPPSVVFQVGVLTRSRILINWKFLRTSKDTTQTDQSWNIVIEASSEIMRLQHRNAEESQVLDAFCPPGMVDSCFINNGYFLAASIICFLVRHRKNMLPQEYLSEVRALLERSLAIWSHKPDLSREESRVVTTLRLVLERPDEATCHSTIEAAAPPQTDEGENQ
ncbi:hypothetical protein N7481_003200 [Penicillium waksmanii]|uniref:uncharacterized protein n=1 Tax=Penicillium waksmanii TaxID=69791 RepID=UPI002548B4E9|nr:uncharacterized protein N7481_003200 [Penicillium waksmanii]KAJ5987990.1 hypothetical protein N7481_003200 [Penicillium waksmanii]